MADLRRFAIPISKASDAQLAALSRISDTDIENSRARWKSDAPSHLRELLDAEPVLDSDEPLPPDEG